MIDITLQNFETELITPSLTQPVLLDIWAPWCGPCKALGPVLEKLEVAYAGRFKLAKLNSDDQPEIAGQLSKMFGVRSIPFCVLFKDGQPVDGFVGALPEGEVRQFLDNHVPSADALAAAEDVDAAAELLAEGDTDSALAMLRDAVAADPANAAARCELLRALMNAGEVQEARQVYDAVATKVMTDTLLVAFGLWIAATEQAATARSPEVLAAAIAANKRDFDARFEVAQGHFAAHRFTDAMDELLEIIMRDKTWNDALPRRTYVAILELMAKPKPAKPAPGAPQKGTLEIAGAAYVGDSDPLIDGYRRKLSMAMY